MITEKLEAFISEISTAPQYRDAVSQQPELQTQVDAFASALRFLDQKAAEDADMLESFDEICRIIDRCDLSIKQRMLAVREVFIRLRAAGRTIN